MDRIHPVNGYPRRAWIPFLLLVWGSLHSASLAEPEKLVTKTWPLPPAVLRSGTSSSNTSLSPKLKSNNGADLDLREFLGAFGVQFTEGGTASYSPKKQTLTSINTPAQIQQIDLLIEKWDAQNRHATLLKTIRELSPEQKHRLAENLKQWTSLTAEQKQALRHREGLIRKQASEEAASVEKELPENQRESFHKRYFEARKQLEAELRTEFDKRRKIGLSELLQKIKEEFLSAPAVTKPTQE